MAAHARLSWTPVAPKRASLCDRYRSERHAGRPDGTLPAPYGDAKRELASTGRGAFQGARPGPHRAFIRRDGDPGPPAPRQAARAQDAQADPRPPCQGGGAGTEVPEAEGSAGREIAGQGP